uniref:Uncharacterized protein n=1 Tax=Setaria viridis TaxID=4556 RepID=A0A4U6U979_SETVI|nr:hypothetical protein SEVIR_6G161600v2 [Setaria viridis]TKW10394.1 hypothetical protein SEVIR_6G161600v2 [Setaria viridis]
MLSPRGSHGAHPLPAGGRCSRRGYCCPYCWPSGTTILYPRIWVGIYSVDGCGFTINPQHHPLPPSSQDTCGYTWLLCLNSILVITEGYILPTVLVYSRVKFRVLHFFLA